MEAPPRTARVGGIEIGGTKIVCAVGTGPRGGLRARREFPSGLSPESLVRAAAWLRDQEQEHGRLAAIGIASFGPVDLGDDAGICGALAGRYAGSRLWVRNIYRRPRLEEGAEWALWQFANRGRMPGVETFIDRNVFRGSSSQFGAFLCGGKPERDRGR